MSPLMVFRSAGLVLVLVAAVLILAPLAFAQPPDPSWIGGWYDDADCDDVIPRIMSIVSIDDTNPPVAVSAPWSVQCGSVVHLRVRAPGPPARALRLSRAPPTA